MPKTNQMRRHLVHRSPPDKSVRQDVFFAFLCHFPFSTLCSRSTLQTSPVPLNTEHTAVSSTKDLVVCPRAAAAQRPATLPGPLRHRGQLRLRRRSASWSCVGSGRGCGRMKCQVILKGKTTITITMYICIYIYIWYPPKTHHSTLHTVTMTPIEIFGLAGHKIRGHKKVGLRGGG